MRQIHSKKRLLRLCRLPNENRSPGGRGVAGRSYEADAGATRRMATFVTQSRTKYIVRGSRPQAAKEVGLSKQPHTWCASVAAAQPLEAHCPQNASLYRPAGNGAPPSPHPVRLSAVGITPTWRRQHLFLLLGCCSANSRDSFLILMRSAQIQYPQFTLNRYGCVESHVLTSCEGTALHSECIRAT